jgi:hypothetical protein
MSSNVVDFESRLKRIDPPGGGGDNGGMEARVSKLEAVIPTLATKVDLMREFNSLKLEIMGDSGAFRADMQKMDMSIRGEMSKMEGSIRADMAKVEGSIRTDMHKEFTAQTWRIIGAMLTFGAMLTTATFFIARYVK